MDNFTEFLNFMTVYIYNFFLFSSHNSKAFVLSLKPEKL